MPSFTRHYTSTSNQPLAALQRTKVNRLFPLQEIFRQIFDDDGLVITPATSRRDVADWDSVAHVKLILSLEEEFGIRFTEDEVSSIQTVAELLDAVEAHKTRNQ
jgi:acyl carrier protein